MNNKFKLTKVLALGATSAALFVGAAAFTSNPAQAASTTLLKFKHNAYEYNSKGYRKNKKVIKKGAKYYYTKSKKIRGKKYYKLDTKGSVYVKKGNVKVTTIHKTVTLKHNAYQYNSKGKRVKSAGTLKKGDSYFVWGTKKIKGKKYYRVDHNLYIKAANVATAKKAKSNNTQNNDNNSSIVSVTQFSGNSNSSANVGTSQVVNNSGSHSQNSASNAGSTSTKSNTNISSSNTGASQNTGSQTTKPSANTTKPSTSGQSTNTGNTAKPSTGTTTTNKGNSSSSSQKPAQATKTYSENHIQMPAGYIDAVKASNFAVTPETNKIVLAENNQFHSESAADDNMKINYGDLTPAQEKEINAFALRLINEARKAYGSKPWLYTNMSQHVANRVATLYAQDNMGIGTWHDNKALNQVDKEFGINTAELMGGDSIQFTSEEINTMTDLKHAVWTDIEAMLFNTNELEHAKIMLTWNTSDDSKGYTSFGLSISWRANDGEGHKEYSTHFIAY